MPGFGSGPFGRNPFGEWDWSRNVLFETAPVAYRDAQTAEGDYLRKYTQGQQPSFDHIRHHIQNYGDLRDPLLARTEKSDSIFVTLGKQIQQTSRVEQAGILGVVNSSGTFTAGDRTATFRNSDIGKVLFIRRSNVAANNQQYFSITSIVSSKEVFTDPPISTDSGPMRWDVRALETLPEGQYEVEVRGGDPRRIAPGWLLNDGRNSYEVVSRQMFYQPVSAKQLLLDREGSDGRLALTSAQFHLAPYTSASTTPFAALCSTVLEANPIGGYEGIEGNQLRLAFEATGVGTGTLTQSGNDFTFAFQSGVTTPADFEAAVAALPNVPFKVKATSLAVAPLTSPTAVFPLSYFTGGGVPYLSSTSYAFQQQDAGKLIGLSNTAVPENAGIWEVDGVYEGKALFGFLNTYGDAYDPNGTVLYSYAPTADRLVTVTHEHVVLPGLPLLVTYSDAVTNRLDVTVRLATDTAGNPSSLPSDIEAAITANVEISKYIQVTRPYGVGTEAPAGEFPQTQIKPAYLFPESQPIYWGLRPFARLVVQGELPLGAIAVDGADLVIPAKASQTYANQTVVSSDSAPFKLGDEGKLLTIRGSRKGNDGTYEIAFVDPSGTTVRLDAVLNTTGGADVALYYALRTNPIFIPNPTALNPLPEEVEVSAEPLLNLLAYDFGIEVDTQQVEIRQRSWVKQVSQWTAIKGTPESIENIATLCGFTASVSSLNSIPAHPLMGNPATPLLYDLIFVGDAGRAIPNGALTRVAGFPRFTAANGNFSDTDVGKVLKIAGSALSNNNYYVIAELVSATQVRLLEPSVGANLDLGLPITTPDSGLSATVGQLYTSIAPEFPRMDDIDFDTLAVMYNLAGYPLNNRPGLDSPCDVQHIKIGHDFDGYAKAELDCGLIGVGTYNGVFEATTAGEGGDNITVSLIADSAYSVTVVGDAITIRYNAATGFSYEIDNFVSGIGITGASNAGGLIQLVTGGQPHGLTAGDTVTISGVAGTVEANGTWTVATVASPYFFTLAGSFYIHPYTGGGTVTRPALNDKIRLKTPSIPTFLFGFQFFDAPLYGGLGNTPPQVVTLDPPTGLFITAVSTSGFTHTVTIEGEDLRAITYPSKLVANAVDNGLGRIQITTVTPHALLTNNVVTITDVLGTTEANGTWQVTVIDPTTFDLNSSTFTNAYISGGQVLNNDATLGEWKFVDENLRVFFMDGLPKLLNTSPWTWEVQTTSTLAPATVNNVFTAGPTYFEYLCPLAITCDYCPSYRVAIDLTPDQIIGEGTVAQENVFERTSALIAEAIPAHAEPVYNYIVPFTTSPLLAYVSSTVTTS